MTEIAKVPPEPVRITALDVLAPKFAHKIMALLEDLRRRGHDPIIFESLRSPERQEWLYQFGRQYDDGRGVVTNARSVLLSWHGYGLAVDIVSASKGWDDSSFFEALGVAAEAHGLMWGGTWAMKDLPHVQWGPPMRKSPSPIARALFADAGAPAVWREVGAAL